MFHLCNQPAPLLLFSFQFHSKCRYLSGDKTARNYYDVDGNIVSNSKTLIANPKAEKARDMLEIYYKGGRYNKVGNGINQRLEKVDDTSAEADFELPSFEERNPNFAVACSVMHNDEWHGTPHLHIDFVPIGEGYKKGPEKQLGFSRHEFTPFPTFL